MKGFFGFKINTSSYEQNIEEVSNMPIITSMTLIIGLLDLENYKE
jgi:hypothetical protein